MTCLDPLPTLCASFSRFPSPLGRAMHEAGYRALGLPFVYVPFACSDNTDAMGARRGWSALGARRGLSLAFHETPG